MSRCFGFIIISVVMWTVVPVTAYSLDVSSYLPLKVGNSWHYLEKLDDGNTEVFTDSITMTVQFGDKLAYVFGGLDPECWAFEGWADAWFDEGLLFFGETECENGVVETELYDPPLLEFPGEMDIGETKQWSDGGIDFKASIVGFESVTVPAGTFDSLKIGWELAEEGEKEICESWMVESVGVVKEECDFQEDNTLKNETMELISAVIDGQLIGNPLEDGKTYSFDMATVSASGCGLLIKNIVKSGNDGPELWWAGFLVDTDTNQWILESSGKGSAGLIPEGVCPGLDLKGSMPTIDVIQDTGETKLYMLVHVDEQLYKTQFLFDMDSLAWDLVFAEPDDS